MSGKKTPAADRIVDTPPPDNRGRLPVWPSRLTAARTAAPKWAVWDYKNPGSAHAAAANARKYARLAPGGADAYDIVGRTTDTGGAVYVLYTPQLDEAPPAP